MTELVESELPGIEFAGSPSDFGGDYAPPVDEEAPYGYKKDGTPAKKRGRQPGSGGGSTVSKAKAETLQVELADKISEITMPIAIFSPLAGAVIDERAERTAKALVTLAGKSARFAKGIDMFIKGTAYSDLIMLPFAVGVAVMVDYQRIAVESGISRKLHIDDHWLNLYGSEGTELLSQGQNSNGVVSNVGSRSGLA